MRLLLFLCALIALIAMAVTLDTNKFSTNLFKTVAKHEKKNIVLSTFSTYVNLFMAAVGAGGNTAKEMYSSLDLPKEPHREIKDLLNKFKNVAKEDLKLAARIFTSKSFTVKPEYEAVIAYYFQSTIGQVDFKNAKEAARLINSWFEKQTNNQVKDIISPGEIAPSTSMLPVNTLYFKRQWHRRFNKDFTTPRPFKIDNKTVVDVQMMHEPLFELLYGELPQLNAKFVEIPYENEELHMTIIIPDDNNSLEELEKNMEKISLESIRQVRSNKIVKFYLPKFKVEKKFDLHEHLMEMGMQEMFTSKANFSGITDKFPFPVSSVIQKAVFEVDEEGGETSAAEVVRKQEIGAAMELEVNKPFLYYVTWQPKNTSQIVALFNGRMKNPIEE